MLHKFVKSESEKPEENYKIWTSLNKFIKKWLTISKEGLKELRVKILEYGRTFRTNRALKKNGTLKTSKVPKGRKKYFTIMLVPHASSKVKTIRISHLYTKLVLISVILIFTSMYTFFRIDNITNENTILKSGVEKLYDLTNEQKVALNEQVIKVNRLLEENQSINIDINEYVDNYRNIVDKYVSGRIDSGLASRSGDRSENAFIKDVNELKEILAVLSEVNELKDENFIDLTETEEKLENYLNSIPDLYPVNGRITSKFGYRIDPFTFRRSFHKGTDFAASYGTDIKASAGGKVILAGTYNELGRAVIIDHGNGISTIYGHTSATLVNKGQVVKKGTVIAKVGSSGRSTGSHLHFEIHLNGEPIDPLKYLE